MGEPEMKIIAEMISEVIDNIMDKKGELPEEIVSKMQERVHDLTERFPLYQDLKGSAG
jgi:glycine/serine hydroxymethyltransferase